MKKKVKFQVGDIFLIPFEDGRFGAGRILKRDEATMFVELYKMRPLNDPSLFELNHINTNEAIFKIWCYDEGIRKGEWNVAGHKEVELPVKMPGFWDKSAYGKYYLIPGADTHEGDISQKKEIQKEEIGDASPYGIGGSGYVEKVYAKKLKEIDLF
ncbi:Imm26 family immunity protein [Cohnella cellulosilytica]|uniref:Imm26 family immunity protein n=1 Tax=Cohnella cellulosilytica TaxID=986710 RepID=A0ABW2FIQ2_9BACL